MAQRAMERQDTTMTMMVTGDDDDGDGATGDGATGYDNNGHG